jgi:hypothetical protein
MILEVDTNKAKKSSMKFVILGTVSSYINKQEDADRMILQIGIDREHRWVLPCHLQGVIAECVSSRSALVGP